MVEFFTQFSRLIRGQVHLANGSKCECADKHSLVFFPVSPIKLNITFYVHSTRNNSQLLYYTLHTLIQ
jgi:hypothetical protein